MPSVHAGLALAYWDEARPDSVLRTAGTRFTDPDTGLRPHLHHRRSLNPVVTYGYRVWLDGKPCRPRRTLRFRTQPLWRWRGTHRRSKWRREAVPTSTRPAYDRPGKPYGGDYQIFNSIADQRPDLMLWLGDNVYLREPDWGSWSGIVHRYTHTRSLPELQRLLRGTDHVAIWDDHDFGLERCRRLLCERHRSRAAFDLFWANPTTSVKAAPGTTTTMFQYNDIDFFLLDDRSVRVPASMKTKEPTAARCVPDRLADPGAEVQPVAIQACGHRRAVPHHRRRCL